MVGKQIKDIETQDLDLKDLRGPRDWYRFLFNIPHPETMHYKDLAHFLKGNRKVIRTGFVSDEDLVAIYNLATAYCQPSFYEGFGLPVIEAMVCGTPVIISKTQALVEVANNAALTTDPQSPKDIASKIEKLIKNNKLRNEYSQKGLDRVKMFSWKKTAKETISFYKEILNE